MQTNHLDNPYAVERAYTIEQAREYCAKLAKSHYENFLVASLFVPRELRQHFHNIYAYCRISDDLGDETGGPERALPLLDWWEHELELCYSGQPNHPVFMALSETNARFGIPKQPYADLLKAFRQDQTKTRYADHAELLQYCRYSANPVGRLVLYLGGYCDEQRQGYSDATCSGLQLANFWQDVYRDYGIGRIYLPQQCMQQYGVTEQDIAQRRFSPEFAQLLKHECEWARELFAEGMRLLPLIDRRLRLDIEMFSRGGIEILQRIEAQGYDVLTTRPTIPKSRQLSILLGRLAAGVFSR